jgi:hypothetical protein
MLSMNFFNKNKTTTEASQADQSPTATKGRRFAAAATLAGLIVSGGVALGPNHDKGSDAPAPSNENVPAQIIVPGTELIAKSAPAVEPGPTQDVAPHAASTEAAAPQSTESQQAHEPKNDQPKMPPGIIDTDNSGPKMPPGIIDTGETNPVMPPGIIDVPTPAETNPVPSTPENTPQS